MVTWGSAIRSRGRGACPMTPLKWNPHSLLLITPNPTPSPNTQLTLVYNTYVYPQREEEKDSRMAGFKLGVFYREAHLIGPQESCCSTIGRTQKAVWILAQFPSRDLTSPAKIYKNKEFISRSLLLLIPRRALTATVNRLPAGLKLLLVITLPLL